MSQRLLVTVPDERWLDLWRDAGPAPAVDVVLWDLGGDPAPDPAGRWPVAVVLPYLGRPQPQWRDRFAAIAGLRAVQTLTAGYEGVAPLLPPGVTLHTAAGVHDASTAELAVALAIAGLRGFGDAVRDAASGRWHRLTRRSLADRRVLLIGAGHVGTAIADRLAPFEVSLTRVAGRAREDGRGRVHAAAELPGLLPGHDVVILACPLTDATRGLVDAGFLAALPDGALLVNVSRGPVVVTDALVAQARTGRLSAALDVTDPEPLPPDHPLWPLPNVLITPHVGGDTTAFVPRGRALLRRQFAALAAGEPPVNLVAVGGSPPTASS